MANQYRPPEQSRVMQFVDIVFLILAIFTALWLPLKLGLAGASKEAPVVIENPTWEKLGQNAAQAAMWEKLGKTPADAHDTIQSRFNYTINWPELIAMAVVLFAYFFFLFRLSDKEYREVIDEKFGNSKK